MNHIHMHKICIAIFFGIYFIIGISLYKDYGISWDEDAEYYTGKVYYNYFFSRLLPEALKGRIDNWLNVSDEIKDVPQLHDYADRDHGSSQLLIFILSKTIKKLLNACDFYYDFQIRHVLNFIICYIGAIFFYKIVRQLFTFETAFLTTILFVISPRFFAEEFYNSKDLIFMSTYCLAIYCLNNYIKSLSLRDLVIYSLTIALSISTRIVGINIIPASLLIFFIMWKFNYFDFKKMATQIFVMLISIILFVYLLFPALWANPVHSFINIFKNMAHFRWEGNYLFLGEIISANNTPSLYLPVWIAITLPIITLISFTGGTAIFIYSCVHQRNSFFSNRSNIIILFSFVIVFGSILSVIFIKSVLYDGWRHFYFIYPSIMIIAAYFINLSVNNKNKVIKFTYYGLLIFNIGECIKFDIIAHPLQNVYFNILLPSEWKDKMEVDYWGLSNKQMLDMINNIDKRDNIKLYAGSSMNLPGALLSLKEKERKRFNIVDNIKHADYIITNYRLPSHSNRYYKDHNFYILHKEKLFGNTIYAIYKNGDN